MRIPIDLFGIPLHLSVRPLAFPFALCVVSQVNASNNEYNGESQPLAPPKTAVSVRDIRSNEVKARLKNDKYVIFHVVCAGLRDKDVSVAHR